MKTLSLVIPVYNAPDLSRAAVAALPELARTAEACGFALVEAIFVDDGSSPPLDLSEKGVTRSCASETAVAQERDPPVLFVRSRRNATLPWWGEPSSASRFRN